jgi:hypothetical protein
VFHLCLAHSAYLNRSLQPSDMSHLLAEIEGALQDASVCPLPGESHDSAA